jgi:hypothetical protein
MRIPGFSAESSLSGSKEPYKGYGDATLHNGTQQVQPQRCVRSGNTINCTQCSDGYCWTNVIHIPTLY